MHSSTYPPTNSNGSATRQLCFARRCLSDVVPDWRTWLDRQFPRKRNGQRTQLGRLIEKLCERFPGAVLLPEINSPRPTGLGIAQHGARLSEARELGFVISNEQTHGHDSNHSQYQLLSTPWESR